MVSYTKGGIQAKGIWKQDPEANIFKTFQNNNIACCTKCLWNMVSYTKVLMQAKGIWKQDPEANIWTQEGWEWGVEKAPHWGTS